MNRRRWLAIAGLTCALLGAWGAATFLRETHGDEGGSAAADRAGASAKSVDRARDSSSGSGDASSDDARSRELTPTVVAFDPRLEWPDVAALRRIEQRGRALFGGIVYAPDGSPCAGATIFCNRDAIATSDDHGAWRADVSRPSNHELDGGLEMDPQPAPAFLLAAHKEGVGFAESAVDPVSRRVDLRLHGGFSFRGTVIDNDDLRPVRGAELEARVRSIVEQVRADARGDFCFPSLPSGSLELSGRAPGYDSNGSFSYNFDRGRDVEITFRLTKAYRLRGQFAPWPAPGVAPAEAQVVLSPKSPHAGPSAPTVNGAVAADGSFDLSLPVCPVCRVELAGERGSVWETELDVNEEKHDVNLGRIDLAGMATLTGRVELPDGALRSSVEVAAAVSFEYPARALLRGYVGSDGAFRIDVPAGPVSVAFELAGWRLLTLKAASGVTAEERDVGQVVLAPGETRDLGVITPSSVVLVLNVRDARGEPVALAQLRETWDQPDLARRIRSFFPRTVSDEEGRLVYVLDASDPPSSPLRFGICARGFAPQRVDVEFQEGATWIRRDVVLPDGIVLRGTLVDESGAPLGAASIRAEPEAAGDFPYSRSAYDVTQADGSFVIRGLDSGEWKLFASPRGGPMVRFTKIDPGQGPLTLRMADGVVVARPSLPR